MADMLGISYLRVCMAAAIPAVLYFFALLYMVHMEALRQGLRGLPRAELPRLGRVLKEGGYLLLPAPFLVILLVLGYSPMKAGFWSIVAVLLVSSLKKASRMSPGKILQTLERGARGSLEVLTACATAGIVIGVVTQTGLGLKFSSLVIQAAGGQLLLALIFVMVTSLILGMGLTTSAAYILTVILGGPVLTKLGVDPLAAHMFVFYYACLSTITPPVALAPLQGAGHSGLASLSNRIRGHEAGSCGLCGAFHLRVSPVSNLEGRAHHHFPGRFHSHDRLRGSWLRDDGIPGRETAPVDAWSAYPGRSAPHKAGG